MYNLFLNCEDFFFPVSAIQLIVLCRMVLDTLSLFHLQRYTVSSRKVLDENVTLDVF